MSGRGPAEIPALTEEQMLLMGPGIIPPMASYSRSAETEGGNRCSLISKETPQGSQGDHHHPSLKEMGITRAVLHWSMVHREVDQPFLEISLAVFCCWHGKLKASVIFFAGR